MASLFTPPFLDVGGGLNPADGSKLFFNVVGSNVDKDTYTTAAATSGTEHSNPVIADSKGVFPAIYITGDYDWVLQDKNSVQRNTGSVSEFATTANSAFDKNFATLTLAKADPNIIAGDAVNLAERTTGNGGGGMWNVIAGTGTANTYNIVAHDTLSLSFVLRVGNSVDPKLFGAVFDDSADDSGAIQACFTYAGENNCRVDLPAGISRFTGILIDADWQGLTIRGAGHRRSVVGTGATTLRNNGTGYMFNMTGDGTCTGLTMQDFSFHQVDATSGGFFESDNASGSLYTDKNSMSFWTLQRFEWVLTNPASKLININAASFTNCKFESHFGSVALFSSVSPYYINCMAPGSYFNNDFNNWFVNNAITGSISTSPMVRMIDNSGGATCGVSSFRNLVFEHAAEGGAMHLTGCRASTFQNIFTDDSGTPNAHCIHLDTSAVAGSLDSAFNTFLNCKSVQGDATWKDIYIESSGTGSQTTLIDCVLGRVDIEGNSYMNVGSNIVVDYSTTKPITLKSGTITNPSGNVNPDIAHGLSAVIATGSSVVVTFTNAFSSTPTVIASHAAATARDGVVRVSGVSTTGFTVHNDASVSTQAYWCAMS